MLGCADPELPFPAHHPPTPHSDPAQACPGCPQPRFHHLLRLAATASPRALPGRWSPGPRIWSVKHWPAGPGGPLRPRPALACHSSAWGLSPSAGSRVGCEGDVALPRPKALGSPYPRLCTTADGPPSALAGRAATMVVCRPSVPTSAWCPLLPRAPCLGSPGTLSYGTGLGEAEFAAMGLRKASQGHVEREAGPGRPLLRIGARTLGTPAAGLPCSARAHSSGSNWARTASPRAAEGTAGAGAASGGGTVCR